MTMVKRLLLEEFAETFRNATELSSVALGGQVLSVSDEFFAEAFHLLLVEPALSLKGQFGQKGALYSGWETRRHNPTFDWCIIKLGAPGFLIGLDIDTTHFDGNEAPEVSVDALFSSDKPSMGDARWIEILPKMRLGPNSRHLFQIPQSSRVNFVKLNIYPDGGIARFRVYGRVAPVFPESSEVFDLAHVFAGGQVIFTSDQHYGAGSNLILPGRGKDIGDGWETKRSREKGHKDWVILKLGTPGLLDHVEVDTAHFKGNFPESCEIHASNIPGNIDWARDQDHEWVLVLPRVQLGPHRQHYFHLDNIRHRTFTHVKLTIYPDGGVQRLRVMGRTASVDRKEEIANPSVLKSAETVADTLFRNELIIPVLPLTPEAFAPFGQVIQAYENHDATPGGTRITPANGGTAIKFHKVALLQSAYSTTSSATTGLSVYRCQPYDTVTGGKLELKVLERHSFTNQAFIPMGNGREEQYRCMYLVVVAFNGVDDKPDLSTIKAFYATAAQGIMYNIGIWHQPMTVLWTEMDFTCVETQIGNGSREDCEIVELGGDIRRYLRIPSL